jgi:hypothetical protein
VEHKWATFSFAAAEEGDSMNTKSPNMPAMKVRLRRDGVLWVVETIDGTWLAGLLCEAARSEYIRRNGYEVVA